MTTREEARRKFDMLSNSEQATYYKLGAFLKKSYIQTDMTDYELARNIYVNRLLNSENGSKKENNSTETA